MKVVKECRAGDELDEYLARNGIKHIMLPVYSAWMGSYWERLIRTIKSSIYKSIGRKRLEYFQFTALLSDIQNAINDRPLSYKDENKNLSDVITPNSFLKLNRTEEISFENLDGCELTAPNRQEMVKALTRRDELFEKFKKLFYEEYLLSLRESSRVVYEENWSETRKIGDVVLICSPVRNRIDWPIGCVTRLLTGNDGKTRCVRVRQSNQKEEVHAVSHLHPLEISLESVSQPVRGKTAGKPVCQERPKRQASRKCLAGFKNLRE